MAHPCPPGGTGRPCALRSASLADWTPRPAPARPLKVTLKTTIFALSTRRNELPPVRASPSVRLWLPFMCESRTHKSESTEWTTLRQCKCNVKNRATTLWRAAHAQAHAHAHTHTNTHTLTVECNNGPLINPQALLLLPRKGLRLSEPIRRRDLLV